LKKDYFITFFISQISFVLHLLSFKLVAKFFGENGFALYNLANRAIAVLAPLMLLGLGISLTRKVAMIQDESDFKGKALLLNALLPVSAALLVFLLFCIITPSASAMLLFGDESLRELSIPIVVYVSGLSLSGILQAFFRGKTEFVISNMVALLSSSIIPVICILLFRYKIEHVYLSAGCATIASSVLYFTVYLKTENQTLIRVPIIKDHLTYGVPRLPGDLSFYMLFMIPSWLATCFYGLEVGGSVAFACTILNLGTIAIFPISYIMLPKASAMLINGQHLMLRDLVVKIILFSCLMSLLGIAIIEFCIEPAVRVFLGSEYTKAVGLIRILAVGLLPYSIFISLRSIIDAGFRRPQNAYNSIAALIVLVSVGFTLRIFVDNVVSFLIALVVSLYALGLISVRDTLRVLKCEVHL